MPNPIKDPKTGVYKIRQAIPLELRPFVEGKCELKRSLHTKDPREAKANAIEVSMEFQAILATARNQLDMKKSNAASLTKSQIEQIARAWRLREIGRLGDPEIFARYVSCGFDDSNVDMQYSSLADLYLDGLEPIGVDADGNKVYSSRRLHAAMRAIAEECLTLAQVELASENPLYTVLCARLARHCASICGKAINATMRHLKHLDENSIVPPIHPTGIAATSTPSTPGAPKISEFFETLAEDKAKSNPKGAVAWKRERMSVVRRFIEAFGDLPLNQITKQNCVEFRDLLKWAPDDRTQSIQKLPLREQVKKAKQDKLPTISLKRVQSLLCLLSGILERARNDALISDNPCHGVKVEAARKARKRAPEYTDEEMATLLASGIFTGEIRPPIASYGEAVYWVPVLLAYTGARLEEICQLFRRDVVQKENHWVIRIQDLDDSQSLKTGKSREIPLHPHLLELGFDRFIARCSSDGPLFPELTPSTQGRRYSDKIGRWLREQFCEILKLKEDDDLSPLHAFRHTFITHMRERNIREDTQNAITGHSQGSNVGRYYGSFRQLHEAISRMPRWPVPAWQPLGTKEVSPVVNEVKA